jgi:hypothetical protein
MQNKVLTGDFDLTQFYNDTKSSDHGLKLADVGGSTNPGVFYTAIENQFNSRVLNGST